MTDFKLPTHLYLLAWWHGRGYPVCIDRARKARIYYEASYALRTLTEILSMPTHHVLIGAWELLVGEDGTWHELPESWLPSPDDIAAARAKRLLVAQESDPSLGPVPFGEGSDDA